MDHGFVSHANSYHKSSNDVRGVSKAYWLSDEYAAYYLKYLWTRWKTKCGKCKHPSGSLCCYKFESLFTKRRLYLDAVRRKKYLLSQAGITELYDDLKHFKIDGGGARKTMEGLVSDGKVPETRIDEEMTKVDRFARMGDDPIAAYVVKDRYGRVHTNITSLKKEIREKCITCDGKDVGSVDIKSSQAAFLCGVLDKWWKLANDPLSVQEPRFIRMTPFWTESTRSVTAGLIRAELDRFIGLLRSGHIYEHFAERIGIPDRYVVKKEWLAFLYAPVYFDHDARDVRFRIRNVWKREFPTLLRCIDSMKKDNYAALAHEMQATESEFVFSSVIPLVRLFVGCPVCTVHDSLIVPADCVDVVKGIMDAELERTGVPTMTVVEMSIIRPTVTDRRASERVLKAIDEHYRKLAAGGHADTLNPRERVSGSRLSTVEAV